MAYAAMMVHVDVDGELDGRVGLAAKLADRFQSHLIGVSAWMPRPPFTVEGVVVDPAPTGAELEKMTAVLQHRGAQFKAIAGADRGKASWRSSHDFPTEFIAREARAADLVIIGRERGLHDPYRSPDAGALLLRTGRPVLIVPPGVDALTGRRVIVAWKDTREARRAVADALPLLHRADEVVVVEVCGLGEEQDCQYRLRDVAQYLAHHRVAAVGERVRPAEATTANALLRLAEEEGADLIVAGAYGHSRLGEWLFGGMTQDLLANSPVCCLFSH
jgi:nucleotide-binding universal stress UspA family protein